jgi:hypothetical protein
MQATRGEIFAVVPHYAEKRVFSFKNATFEIPEDDPDDGGAGHPPTAAVQAGDERWLHYPQLHFELGDLGNYKYRDEG